ncbi:hypothetical protein MACK_003097 [Theileria orientalis]|uniref:Uncharacterized protein n=1 Tax=Theileria orientalis TaxID=68886 RepID=A0A976MEK9_THEOR|nr:hypothetical protein MACK_003097 [Theileria orientalis]
MSYQKKKTNRKYQFDPLSHSSLFHFVSDSVRSHVRLEREKMYKKYEWKRSKRRELFSLLSEVQKNFIPPQTSNENDARALSLNKQIAIKTEIKTSLESLQCLLDLALYKVTKKEEIYDENLKDIKKEELEDRKRIEELRDERRKKFIERVANESKAVLDSRSKRRMEMEAARKEIRDKESEEEARLFFPCDRKLAACGLIPQVYKNPAT